MIQTRDEKLEIAAGEYAQDMKGPHVQYLPLVDAYIAGAKWMETDQYYYIGNSIEGIVESGKKKILIDEIDSAHLKTFIKDIIVLFPCEFNEACEEYEKQGWEVK